uniref:G-protein coupled receptors family 1 profile domain-containing protein n=1 Tax=Gasterosteus aculeatus aculeatus TaxID=481459 RepID=G3PJ04_GASAC
MLSCKTKIELVKPGMEDLNSVVPSNISSSDGHPPLVAWVSTSLIPALVLSVCFLLGVPGNIAVIVLRPNWQHLSSLSQSLVMNLAVSDLLCLLTLPLWIYTSMYSWTFGLVTCKLLTYQVYCSLYGSLLTVTALGVQRYLQVVKLQKCFSQVGRKRMLVLLWLTAMILSVPSLVFRHPTTVDHWTTCSSHYSSSAQQVAVLLTESLPGFVSIAIVVFSYISLQRKVNEAAFFTNPQTTRLLTSIIVIFFVAVLLTESLPGFVSIAIVVFSYISLQRKVNEAAFFTNPQTTRLLTIIIVTFFVLWMPYHITNMLVVAAISRNDDNMLKSATNIQNTVGALVFVNSFMNPLLYAFASRNMCTVCKKREHGLRTIDSMMMRETTKICFSFGFLMKFNLQFVDFLD